MVDILKHPQNPPEELQRPEDLRPNHVLVEHLDDGADYDVSGDGQLGEVDETEDRASLYRRIGIYSVAAGIVIGGLIGGLSGGRSHESNDNAPQSPTPEQPLSTNALIGELQVSYGPVIIKEAHIAGPAKDSSGNGETNALLIVQLDAPHNPGVVAGGRVKYGGTVVVLRNGPGEADDQVLTGISQRSGEKADASKVTVAVPVRPDALSKDGTATLDFYETASAEIPGAKTPVTLYKVGGRVNLVKDSEKAAVKVGLISQPGGLSDLNDEQMIQAPDDNTPVNPQHMPPGSLKRMYVPPVERPARHPN
jgi:hypothetical protein